MSLASRLRALLSRPSPGAREPTPAAAPASDAPNPYLKTDLDWDALAREASTRFERVYYAHRGRAIFKWNQYLPLYDQALARYVGQPLTLVEIGVAAGGSLQLWRSYFGDRCRIIGVDIDPACQAYAEPGVEIMIGSQDDPDFLCRVADQAGGIDVVVDDGSHVSSHQIRTMEVLFPRLKSDGVYVCEDLHTSYWANFGGGLDRSDSYIAYVKRLIDKLHHRYNGMALADDDFAREIGSMTLGDSIAFFQKAPARETYMVQVGG